MRLALLAAVLALIAAACAEHSKSRRGEAAKDASSTKPYTARELTWLRRFGKWDRRYSPARDDAQTALDFSLGGVSTRAEFRRKVAPLRKCGRTLRGSVGDPPSSDLQRAYGLLVETCQKDMRFASVTAPGPTEVDVLGAGTDLFRRAHDLIARRLFASRRRLPTLTRLSGRSRVEPRFGRAASALARRPIEVRCWSRRDWPRAVREYLIYTGYPHVRVAGFALTGRANLEPKSCTRLAKLTHHRWQPSVPRELARAADAVQLLGYLSERIHDPTQASFETECFAMQDIRRLARTLGASPRYAGRLALFYWQRLYPADPANKVPGCRNGDDFDKNRASNVWP